MQIYGFSVFYKTKYCLTYYIDASNNAISYIFAPHKEIIEIKYDCQDCYNQYY